MAARKGGYLGFLTGIFIIGLLLIVAAVVIPPYLHGPPVIGPGGTATVTVSGTGQGECPPAGCILTLPIKITLTNLYDGVAIDTGATDITIYKPSGSPSVASTIVDSGGTDSSGVWTSSKTIYTSGEVYRFYVSYSNMKWEQDIEIPRAQQSQQANFPINIAAIKYGTYTLGLLEPDGVTAIANSGSYNVTTKANTTPRFSFTLSNSVDQSGFTGTFDRSYVIDNGVQRRLQIAIGIKVSKSGGTPSTFVKDWNRSYQTADTFGYIKAVSDHWVDRKVVNSIIDSVLKGTNSDTFQVDATSLAAGATETIAVYFYSYVSVSYWAAYNGSLNTEAVTSASISFSIKA